MVFRKLAFAGALAASVMVGGTASAGRIFLSGHDPDFHGMTQQSGANQLALALNYVTNGTYAGTAQRFLWIESYTHRYPGHRTGYASLETLGLTTANMEWLDGADFAAVELSQFSAIVVASTFGGMTTDAEINALIARKAELASFVNRGGGLAAFAQCGFGFYNCDTQTILPTTQLYGFLPRITSVSTRPDYTVTQAGLDFGLDPLDVNDCCSHNSLLPVRHLTALDYDANGNPTTLIGDIRIHGDVISVPEPSTWAMMIMGFGAAGAMLRRRRRAQAS